LDGSIGKGGAVMAHDWRYITNGPGELDFALAILRGHKVGFALGEVPQNRESIGPRASVGGLCTISSCRRLTNAECRELFASVVDVSEVFGSYGELFEIEISAVEYAPLVSFTGYYSLKTRRGKTRNVRDGAYDKTFQ
jgi:hypothetical protein